MNWLLKRPIALLNVLFVVIIGALFFYQLVRHIDVLENWHIELAPVKEYRVIDGRRLAVYHPNESMIFTSTSRKVSKAEGRISRTLICEPTQELEEREILLDIIPATKDIGFNPQRASSIILPDVVQFNRLPRVCKLSIDITYTNVALWRNHTEHAETEHFIVEEVKLSPRELKDEIERLKQRIQDLESQQITFVPAQPEKQTQSAVPQEEPVSSPQPTPPQEQGIISSTPKRANGLLNGLLGR